MWLIVNVTTLVLDGHWLCRIPEKYWPTTIHLDEDKARAELMRLARLYPDQDFLLFEAIGELKSVGPSGANIRVYQDIQIPAWRRKLEEA